MQTVNFQCGNCNNLMGVSSEFLGQQVRCPHCQAVVVAPAASPPDGTSATDPMAFTPSLANQQDDIFAPPEPTDDLFGAAESPRVELPPPPREPVFALNGDAAVSSQPAASPFGSTVGYSAPAPATPSGAGAIPSWMDAPPVPPDVPPSIATEPADQTHEETIPHQIRRPRDGGGWFVGLVIIQLISYDLLATEADLVLWYRFQQSPPPPPNQLDTLPSFDPNDEEHSTHLKINQKVLNRIRSMDLKTATGPLLPDRITRLGEKLRVGDLEIIPLKVDRQIVSVISQGSQPEACAAPSLVLHLKLKNISSNVVFQPMDVYFNRKWVSKGQQPPLTILELLDSSGRVVRFFGGPAEYQPPLKNNSGAKPPEEVEGAHASEVLSPGKEMETFVCTDGDDKVSVDAIENYHGNLMWRVHLRRGIITVDAHHLAPVSSVIGVEFTDDDYRKSS